MTGAFSNSITSLDDQKNVDAPQFHVVPYVTGGYQRLLRQIKTDNVPDLPEYGYHTNSEGHFDPKGECMIGLRYNIKKILDAKGQSAVLVLAQDEFSHKSVVVKVLHSHFYQLGGQESHVLRKLAMADPLNLSHTLRLLTTVAFDSHYCLVFEPLLPDPLTSVFSDIPAHRILNDVRRVGLRLLASVGFLHQQNFIHTDLKPDNILLKYENDLDSVHIVDFGNTINYVHSEVSLYYKDFELQTPLYRAPEVMYGLPFGPEIDIWSLGCILAELVIGKPLFFGTTKEEIMEQMTSLLGPFPAKIFRRGKYFKRYKKYTREEDQDNCTLKLIEHLQCRDTEFADLIARMLIYNPEERLTASEAARHPFFASYLPLAFLLSNSAGGSPYPAVSLRKESYVNRPHIPSDIRRQPLSSLDLLRQGTAELPNFEDTTVIKPSPRQGKSRGANLDNHMEIDRKGANMLPNRHAQSDVSVVRNFIVDSDKRIYSKNVKDKMSSLLEAIKQEQDCVEEDLERRGRLAKFVYANVNASHGAFMTEQSRNEVALPRPCPRYSRIDINKVSNEKRMENDSKNIATRKETHGMESRYANFSELSSNKTFESDQMDRIRGDNNKQPVSRNIDRRSSLQSEDSEVHDGSPTAHGVRERFKRTFSSGSEKFSVQERDYKYRKEAFEKSLDTENHSVLSGKGNTYSSNRDTSFVSGSGNDMSGSSDDSIYSEATSSHVETTYSEKPISISEHSQFSDHSTKSKEMNKLRRQVAEKRQNKESEYYTGNRHSQSASSVRTYQDNTHDDLKEQVLKYSQSKSGAKVVNTVSPSLSNKQHPHDERISKVVLSPNYISRKRLASESISDEEEYLELLSPLLSRSNKKKVKSAHSGRFVTKTHLVHDDQSPYRKYDSQNRMKPDLVESSTDTVGKTSTSSQVRGIYKSDSHRLASPSNQRSVGKCTKLFDKEYKDLPDHFHMDDLTPSSRHRRHDRVERNPRSIENKLPSVTPIKKEEKKIGIKNWTSDSPEIVYKDEVMKNRKHGIKNETENCSRLPRKEQGEKGLNRRKDQQVPDLSNWRSGQEWSRRKSSELIKSNSFDKNCRASSADRQNFVRRSSFDRTEQVKTIPKIIGDYSFKGTPDTDVKQLAARGGYAERIAQISRKRKKARKSLAFDSRRSSTTSYEGDDKDEIDSNVWYDNSGEKMIPENFDCCPDEIHRRPKNLNDKFVNPSSKPKISNTQHNRIDSNDVLYDTGNSGEKMIPENFDCCPDEMHRRPKNLNDKFVNPSSQPRISNTQNIRRNFGEDHVENWKQTHFRNKDGHETKIQHLHKQHVRKPVLCSKDIVGPKFQKDFKYMKKFDSTFTIDFESPLRDHKLDK